ncbi:hypothetical protein BDR05DRAFT_1004730 [Suillus weaverae]|nr:hypothetical protein BDR05DRAFT_1004730 [Suillus weaverae]
MALKDSFAHTRVAGVIVFIATAECFETDDVAGKVVSAVVGATLARENDQAFKAVELFVKCLQAHAATMPETAATDDDGKDLSARLPGRDIRMEELTTSKSNSSQTPPFARIMQRFTTPLSSRISYDLQTTLLREVPAHKKEVLTDFLVRLYSVYVDLHFAYLEINPLVVLDDGSIHYLDMAAKLDRTAESIFEISQTYIQKLDTSTGASLKLTVLNPTGRVWTMVAGGGASVVYSDAIAAAGFAYELANYGEYSGAPSEGQTFEYAKTILDLLTRPPPRSDGKILIIGGGITNFTNVAATFKGIIHALTTYKTQLIAHKAKIIGLCW